MGPPGPGAPCLGDLGSILCDARRGLERRPQWGQRELHSGSGARRVAAPGWVGAGSQGAQLCPGRVVVRPLPAPPPPALGRLRRCQAAAYMSQGKDGVSARSAQSPRPTASSCPAWVPAPSSRLAADGSAGPSGGFPAGRGRHRPSVDSSQRRKPAGVLGARPGSALPSPEPAVSAAPGEDPAAPGEVWRPGGGLLAHPSHPHSGPIPVLLLSWESGPTKPRPLDTASACLKP